jgi:hypothetical protein
LTTTAWDDALFISKAGAGLITGGGLAVGLALGLGLSDATGLGETAGLGDTKGFGETDGLGLGVSANVGKLGIKRPPKAIREVRSNFHLIRLG